MKKLIFTLLLSFFCSTALAASLVNDGSINFNGSWQTTGDVDALHASTNLNIDNGVTQYSGYWSGNASNTDYGVVIYLTSLSTPATGRTITATLQSDDATDFVGATDEQTATFVTASGTKILSRIFLKYGAGELENASLYYRVKFTTDTALDTGLRADAAATTKVAIIQVLSATATLSDGDTIFIVGASTQTSGNPDAATVTYNVETGAGTAGDNGHGTGSIVVYNGGVLACAATAAKNYYLEVAGDITTTVGSTWSMQPAATSTLTFEVNTTAAIRGFYISANTTLVAFQGTAFTGNVYKTTLSATSAASDTTLDVVANVQTAGWKADDRLVISTTSGAGETEEVVISSVSGTTITIDAPGVVNQHLSGAEVQNLTRNVKITTSGTSGFYFQPSTTVAGAVDFDWVEFFDCYMADTYGLIYQVSGAVYPIGLDYCSFDTTSGVDTTHPIINTAYYSPLNFTYSNLFFWLNGVNTTAMQFSTTASGAATAARNMATYTLDDISIAKTGSSTASMLHFYNTNITLNNFNAYDYASGTATNFGIGFSDTYFKINNGKFWGLRNGLGVNTAIGSGSTYTQGYSKGEIKNSIFGGDGTNTVANANNDIYFGNSFGAINLWNTKLLSGTEVVMPTDYSAPPQEKYIASHNHDATQYRYKTTQVYGTLTDNTTTSVTAQGGSGTCLVMNPTSSTAGETLNWEFWIPVTAATNPQLKFYIWGSAGTPTLNIDIYDSDDDTTLLCNNESLAFGGTITDWTQKTPTFATNPTDTGWCRVVIKALDDGSTRNIGIDTLTYVLDGTTYTVDFERWKDALPDMAGEGAGAGGGSPIGWVAIQ